jgi:hypothetical protein
MNSKTSERAGTLLSDAAGISAVATKPREGPMPSVADIITKHVTLDVREAHIFVAALPFSFAVHSLGDGRTKRSVTRESSRAARVSRPWG